MLLHTKNNIIAYIFAYTDRYTYVKSMKTCNPVLFKKERENENLVKHSDFLCSVALCSNCIKDRTMVTT